MFDTAAAISWYAERDASIENEKLRKEVDDLRAAAESELNPGTIDYERYRLTKAQADAQELKNAEREGLVLETELFTYILQRVAQEITGILSRIPLVLQRKYPDLCQSHIDVVRTEIARASGRAATIADVEKWTDDFRRPGQHTVQHLRAGGTIIYRTHPWLFPDYSHTASGGIRPDGAV